MPEGISKFLQDLNYKAEEFQVLVLAWKFNASEMCKFTRNEFINGMKSLKVDSIEGIQSVLPIIVNETLSDCEKYKELYRFTFKFGLEDEIGQRSLPIEMAINLWYRFSQIH